MFEVGDRVKHFDEQDICACRLSGLDIRNPDNGKRVGFHAIRFRKLPEIETGMEMLREAVSKAGALGGVDA